MVSLRPKHVVIARENVRTIGVYGHQNKSVREFVGGLTKFLGEKGFETAEKGLGFVAAFSGKPIIDTTWIYGPVYVEMTAFALDRPGLIEEVRGLAESAGLVYAEQNHEIMEKLQPLADMENAVYERCKRTSNITGIPVESLFGASHYLNFLMKYRSMKYGSASKIISKRFRINPELLRERE